MSNLINGRTPDEIKKALRLCNTESVGNCKECPYYADCDGQPGTDALAYIECLEEKTSRFNCLLATLIDTMNALASAQPKWISVDERLPERYTPVLGGIKKDGTETYIEHVVIFDGSWWAKDTGVYYDDVGGMVTHWMPLPEPPEVEG